MTPYGVIVQPRAEQELERAYRHMAKHAPHLADRWLDDIQAAVGSLEELPSRCGLAPEASAVGRPVRQLLHGEYRILFIVLDRHVRVLTVRHQHRKPLRRIAVPWPC